MKHTIKEIADLAARSGFSVIGLGNGYVLQEDETKRKIPLSDGKFLHKNADELFESLTERA